LRIADVNEFCLHCKGLRSFSDFRVRLAQLRFTRSHRSEVRLRHRLHQLCDSYGATAVASSYCQ
jgi:hypothetical protein